jgi:hypothetical protein
VPNVLHWQDAVTVRAGVEYRLLPNAAEARGRLALRLGYVHDGKTTNRDFPSAFGTPPAATRVVTAGAGWNAGPWQLNLAYGRRAGSGRANDPAPNSCPFCGAAGNQPYKMTAHGLYVDGGLVFD